MPLRKIVVIGPESTGKSTLCEGLAAHFALQFQTDWVPEYAREYLLKHGKNYQFPDLTTIARGQLKLEEAHAASLHGRTEDTFLFIDTDMYVMKVWGEFVFGRCDVWILDQIVRRKYDGYLLCRTDLPWTEDELREYPDLLSREKLFHMYKDCMSNQSTPWREVGGQENERLQSGIASVREMLGLR
jgi:NadR type nicotinamide-nucleotide adenylyltransferase